MDSNITFEINKNEDNNTSILIKRQNDDLEASEDEARPANALGVDTQMPKEDAQVTSEISAKQKQKKAKKVADINYFKEKQAEQIQSNRDQVRNLYRNFENSAITSTAE